MTELLHTDTVNLTSEIDTILLLAHGSPNYLEEVPPFMKQILGARENNNEIIESALFRYGAIGGSSPLNAITQRCAKKLSMALGLPVYVGMRCWRPYIYDSVTEIAAQKLKKIFTICLAPHYSSVSIGRYKSALSSSMSEQNLNLEHEFLDSWHDEDELILMWSKNIGAQIAALTTCNFHLIFSAHSIPASNLRDVATYTKQLTKTCNLIARQLNLQSLKWTLCFQSAPPSKEPWLEPKIEDVVALVASKGAKDVIVAPIGFVSEHVEILYDLDIKLRQVAQLNGAGFHRTAMPNDSNDFIRLLANMVKKRCQQQFA